MVFFSLDSRDNYHLIFQSEEKARPVSNKELEAKQRAREARSAMRERRNLTDMINQVRNKDMEAKQRAREARSVMRERRNLTDIINQVRNKDMEAKQRAMEASPP